MDPNNIIQDIYFLYELSLAVGKSIDLTENCRHFLNTLHNKKGFDYSAIWIKNQHLYSYLNPDAFSLVHATPSSQTIDQQIADKHPALNILQQTKEIKIFQYGEKEFVNLITEKNIEKGAYALIPLKEIGFIKIYSNDPKLIQLNELNKLKNILEQFTTSIQGSIFYQVAIENELKISAVIDSALDGVIIIDQDSKVIRWNKQAEKIFGWQANEIIGMPMADFIIPHNLKATHTKGMEHYHQTGEGPILNKRIEVPAMRKNGEIFDLELTVLPIKLDHTTIFGSFVRDITDEKKAKKDLEEAIEKARASSIAKERFLANISHEIRTPLNAIYGMSDLLDNTYITGEQKKYLSAIKVSTEQLLVIVNDILDLSRIESGKMTIKSSAFNLKENIEHLIQSSKPKAIEKGIELKLEYDHNISPIIVSSPVRIMQVLRNLVDNAIKFTFEGEVKLMAKLVSKTTESNTIQFEVKDTGIGINEEKLDTIFESFSQEDESISRRFGGTGLGLSICKKLVDRLGGNLQVESQKDAGSTFSFFLSLAIGSQDDLPEKKPMSQIINQLIGVKVLLVEDHEINQLLAITILQNFKMEVIVANNGQEAIDKVKNTPDEIEIILMDMQMPVMDGLQATKIIREEYQLNIPIIALTANATKAHEQKCLDAGMNDFISKPFNSELLAEKIYAQLNKELKSTDNSLKEASNQESSRPLYDLTKLNEIAKGNQAFIDKMIKLFIDRTPDAINDLQQHLANKEYDRVKALAHKLKPSIDFLNIHDLKEDIRSIEDYSENRIHLDKLPALLTKLENICLQVIEELKTV